MMGFMTQLATLAEDKVALMEDKIVSDIELISNGWSAIVKIHYQDRVSEEYGTLEFNVTYNIDRWNELL
jgi:hypothetical protein